MKTGRILLASLCSAASLTTVGGAMAADLPIKAKAVEYVRVLGQIHASSLAVMVW